MPHLREMKHVHHVFNVSGLGFNEQHHLFSSSLCKGRTLYSVVRDAKVVLDVNKTRQIAQEMVKVKQLSADSPEHFSDARHATDTQSHLCVSPSVLRGWATSTPRGSYTKT